jgi:(2Fe-2S) ferredoxin
MTSESKSAKASDAKAAKLNLSGYERHIIFCGGPSCCKEKEGERLWKHLKDRLKELGLTEKGTARVFRTKAKCLRVCADGPIAVVYPEGTWYRHLDQQGLDRIIEDHLLHGQPVSDYVFSINQRLMSSVDNLST